MAVDPARIFRIGDLVQQFGGDFKGDPEQCIIGFATLENATANQLAFLSNPKYKGQVGLSQAAAVLIASRDAAELDQPDASGRLWIIDRPYLQFARISQYLQRASSSQPIPGIHASAVVDASAQIDASACIGPQAVIGAHAVIGARAVIGAACVLGEGAEIGADTLLHARVTLYPYCRIGQRGIVHSGAVIGADGFGFALDGAAWIKIPQTGRVLIGDDVEIGANTTIDRGALDDTLIDHGVKLDNQIQIGHNVHIGEHTAIAGCVAVAGSAVIGKRCTIAGGVRIVGHISLADDVHVSATTLVTHSIHQPGAYSGAYPMDRHDNWQKNAAALKTLHKLRDRIRTLEQQFKD